MRVRMNFPGPEDHTLILGRNGSGKTVAGGWHLVAKDFNKQPWLIVNTKGDTLLNELATIEGVQTIDINETPGDVGLYIVNPTPDQGEEINQLLWRVWRKGNTGTYIDEGYAITEEEALNALLTQGRSRRCPVIILSQRPAWLSRFAFSECNFIHLFNLQIQTDRKKIGEIVPVDKDYRLAPFHSYWYDVKQDSLQSLTPVPPPGEILQRFRAKFPPKLDEAATPADVLEIVEPEQRLRGRRYL